MTDSVRAIALALLVSAVAAPTSAQGVQAGIKLGANLASATVDSGEEENLENKAGLAAGGFVRVGSRAFAVQPEVLFSMKGGQDPEGGDEFTLALNYVEIPVLLRLGLPAGAVAPFLVVGPAIGLRLSAKADPGGVDVKDDFKSTDVGIAIGGGIELGRLSLEARLTQSLNDIVTEQGHAEIVEGQVKNRVISFLLGITF
jgi:hypothetical protein